MSADPRMFPLAAVEFVIGRAFVSHADAKQRAECVERVEAPVKAKRELIEVGLQMLRADCPVMGVRKINLAWNPMVEGVRVTVEPVFA